MFENVCAISKCSLNTIYLNKNVVILKFYFLVRSRSTKAYYVVQANLSPPPFDETASEPQTPPKINGFMRRSSDSGVVLFSTTFYD